MTIITGRLLTAGQITTCENYPQEFADDLSFDRTSGILLSMTDDNVRAAAAMLGKEIEIQLVGKHNADISNLAAKFEGTAGNLAMALDDEGDTVMLDRDEVDEHVQFLRDAAEFIRRL
jgi:hypothetical protein